MSKNRNRAKSKQVVDNPTYRKIWINFEYPRYYDEGVMYYPKYRKGRKNPLKRIERYKQRMYRTWKYNRKTKWK